VSIIKNINKAFEENTELSVKAGGTYSYRLALNG
jgi:hypothetical protein